MCADQYAGFSGSDFCNDLCLFRPGFESTEDPHADPMGDHAFFEGCIMLLRQNRCGHQKSHLFSIGYRLERSPNGNLRFSEAHVAANEAIHGFVR